jgi:hypothetical protein
MPAQVASGGPAVQYMGMKDLPYTEDSLVLRTDFSDEAAWDRVCDEIEAPVDSDGEVFRAYASFVSDPDFDGLGISALTALGQRTDRRFLFVVDRVTLTVQREARRSGGDARCIAKPAKHGQAARGNRVAALPRILPILMRQCAHCVC